MSYLYPNGDSQQLNLSWFLAKFKDLYEYVMNLDPGEASMDTILSRFTDQYDPATTYVAGDYCIFDGYIYKANQATSGMFNSGAWDPALPVNDIQGLRILISQLSQTVQDLGEDAVTDVQYTPGAATANGLLRKTVNGSTSTVMTVDKEPTENSQNPVKSGSVYEELTELKGSLNAKLPVYNTTTSSDSGIPTDAEIISSLSLGGSTESFLVNFKLSNGRIAFVVIWEKLWTNLASGIGFGYYDSYKTIVKYNVNSETLRKYKPDVEIEANSTYINRLIYNTASVETTDIASKAYSIGELVVVNGVLYQVTSAISSGDTFTVNTNIVLDTIANHLPIVQDVQLDLSAIASNITNRNTFCKKFGNMIFLAIDVEVTGSTSSSMGIVLPQGSRPSGQISTPLGNGLSTGVVSIVIKTNGEIVIYPQGSGYCQGVVTFLTN